MRVKLPSPSQPLHERMRALQPRRFTPVSPIDIFESDEHAIFELGSPAYRIARNRSGLGYIETQAELARCEGVMIRWLLTGKFWVNTEPTVIFAMIFLGLYCAALPLGLALVLTLAGWPVHFDAFVSVAAAEVLVGVFALVSGIASLGALIRRRSFRDAKS